MTYMFKLQILKLNILIAIFILLFAGCIEKEPDPIAIVEPIENFSKADIEWGIGIYPPNGFSNTNPNDWDDAFKKAEQVGKIAHLEVTHDEMTLDDMFFLYDLKVPLAKKYNMKTFVQINTFAKIPDPIEYRKEAIEIAKKYKPDYMCLGQEINYIYDDNSEENYKQFVKDLLITYLEVKKVSPNTEVFPSFAYEPMRAKHQEFLFEDFEKEIPYFPMTSYPMNFQSIYPGYLYDNPGDIPDDYWDVSDITSKDVFITEVGWSTNPKWGSSRQKQAEFVFKANKLIIENPKVKKVVWITMMDIVEENTRKTYGYPGTMGFFTINGEDKGNWKLIIDNGY